MQAKLFTIYCGSKIFFWKKLFKKNIKCIINKINKNKYFHYCSKQWLTLLEQLCDDELYILFQSSQPAISMTPSTRKQYDPLKELDALETPKPALKSAASVKKTSEKSAEKKSSNSGSSWFGGLFSKLAPKPRNQMILPDDNNPTVNF